MSAGDTVAIPAGEHRLAADILLPPRAAAVVVFAHGSGSGRASPRNVAVAQALHEAGIGSLLLDLLTAEEDAEDRVTRRPRFDVEMLGARVVAAVDWLAGEAQTPTLPAGAFGASTGAAAALIAAAARPQRVQAVVSRGGRPDLAGGHLPAVRAPTLLIVGGADPEVLALNRQAAARMTCPIEIEVVPGAGHLFSEPGALERVAELTVEWFGTRLGTR